MTANGVDDPERRGPVPEEPPADVRGDPVDAQQCRRSEDEHLEQDDRRHRLQEGRARDPGDRRLEERPEVADLGGGQDALSDEPSRRRVDDLIASLEPDPAVVLDGEGKHDRRENLRADERSEDGTRSLEQPIDRSPAPAGSGSGASDYRHRRPPSGTRRRCARFPRAAVSAPRIRRARARGSRRRSGVAGRSASSCPT